MAGGSFDRTVETQGRMLSLESRIMPGEGRPSSDRTVGKAQGGNHSLWTSTMPGGGPHLSLDRTVEKTRGRNHSLRSRTVPGGGTQWVPHYHCMPDPSSVWVIGCFHKTGNALNHAVMSDLARHSRIREIEVLPPHLLRYKVTNKTRPETPEMRKKLLQIAANEFVASAAKSRVLLANQFSMQSRQQWNDMLALVRQPMQKLGLDSQQVKAVFWYRDPFEMIISAVNYHLRAKEKWLDEMAHVQVYKVFYACGRDAAWLGAHGITGDYAAALRSHGKLDWLLRTWESDADSDVCEAVESIRGGRNVTNITYRELIKGASIDVAVRIEAISAVDNSLMMRDTYLSLVDNPNSLVIDLGVAMRHFNATFTRMFTFLGANDIGYCVDTASKHDVNAHHSNVDPNTKRGVHVSSLSGDIKDIERRALATSPWVQQRIQPIRKAMGWASS